MNYSSNMYPNNFGIIHQGVENCIDIFILTRIEGGNVWKIVFYVVQINCSSDETL